MRFIAILMLLCSQGVKAEDIFTNQFEALVASRVNNLTLKDPHMFIEGFGCNDITDIVNSTINDQISTDGDGDGSLDINLITQYAADQPSYIGSRDLSVNLIDGLCADALTCSPNINIVTDIYSNASSLNDCLAPGIGTTSGYLEPVVNTSSPCYVTEPQNADLNLNGINIPLEGYQQASRYQSGLNLDEGLHKGFISEAAAIEVIIPEGVPLIGGDTLFDLLPGGGSCSANDDRDIGPDGVTSGWWFYFNSNSDLIELE